MRYTCTFHTTAVPPTLASALALALSVVAHATFFLSFRPFLFLENHVEETHSRSFPYPSSSILLYSSSSPSSSSYFYLFLLRTRFSHAPQNEGEMKKLRKIAFKNNNKNTTLKKKKKVNKKARGEVSHSPPHDTRGNGSHSYIPRSSMARARVTDRATSNTSALSARPPRTTRVTSREPALWPPPPLPYSAMVPSFFLRLRLFFLRLSIFFIHYFIFAFFRLFPVFCSSY